MEDKLRKFTEDARGTVLSAEEKAAGRAMLEQYMLLTPVRAAAAPAAAKRRFRLLPAMPFGKLASVFSLVLGLMLSSAGVSYAAEGALPGDALYPVKVGVNEERRAALSPTAEAKAAWEAERAERRLAEAETLAQRGSLKAETRASLEADFKRHAEKAKSGIAEIRIAADENAAADVASHLEGSLRAHKKIIAALAETGEETSEVGELEASVDAETTAAVEERGKAEAKVSGRRADEAKNAAGGRREAAANKIAEVRTYLAAKHDALGADATADAEVRLADAQAAVLDGDAKAAAGDYAAAFVAYGKAQRMAQEAKLLIRAGHDLRIRVKLDAQDDVRKDAPSGDSRERANDGGGRTDGADAVSPKDEGGKDGERTRDDGGREKDGIRVDGRIDASLRF